MVCPGAPALPLTGSLCANAGLQPAVIAGSSRVEWCAADAMAQERQHLPRISHR